MGALRNVSPDTPPLRRKPVQAERKNYTYDPVKARSSPGYTILPDSAFADLPRLTRSGSFTFLVLAILRYAGFESGAKNQPNRKPDAITEALPDQFLADMCGTDIRELQRNYDYGVRAKVIERVKVGASHSKLRLALENWATLPDYKEWLKSNLHEADESEDEPESEDPAKNDATDVRLLKKPAPVRPGRATRPNKINCGVRSVSLDFTKFKSLPDILYDPQIKAGDLIIHFLPNHKVKPKSSGERETKAKRHGSRLTLPDSPNVLHTKKRTEGEQICTHPKAPKLCEIFNPILEKSRLSMLEANQKALQAACEALGDLSVNELIEFLGKGRARRQISSHRHVALIIGDAKRDRDARGRLQDESGCSHCGHTGRDKMGLCRGCGRRAS